MLVRVVFTFCGSNMSLAYLIDMLCLSVCISGILLF